MSDIYLEARVNDLKSTVALREKQIAVQAEVLNEKDATIAALRAELDAARQSRKRLICIMHSGWYWILEKRADAAESALTAARTEAQQMREDADTLAHALQSLWEAFNACDINPSDLTDEQQLKLIEASNAQYEHGRKYLDAALAGRAE